MTNDVLNTYLLKKQQEEIIELRTRVKFWRDLCSKLSMPIEKKPKKNGK
jgi:hypothetical protein